MVYAVSCVYHHRSELVCDGIARKDLNYVVRYNSNK